MLKILNNQKNIHQKNIENFRLFYNKPIQSIIPLKIYQAWHSDDLPESVKICIQNIKNNNPEFEHFLFNNNTCRNFIKENFSEEILNAYDLIIPNAIKIDLWRYCVLYKNGGIYLDVKYFCINNFKFIYLTDDEYFCKDISTSGGGIYNAIIICKPGNEIMLKCINNVVDSVNKRFYGKSSLEPTGPLMMKKFFSNNEINNLKLNLKYHNEKTIYVCYNELPILFFNKKYREDQKRYQKHFAILWEERKFYLNKVNKNHIDVFTKKYETNEWGNNNNNNYCGSSGQGSEINQQINTYVPFIKSFIQKYNINSVIDLGCGDFRVGRIIYNDFDIKYYGYDAYKKIIDYHNKQTDLSSDKYKFTHLDFCKDKEQIIDGDLCIIKDVLMHWSLDKIYNFLDYIVENKKFKYIIICNDCLQIEDNTNINDGEFRELSANFYPLKKYNPVILYNYQPKKELSLITI